MEGLQNLIRKISKDPKLGSSTSASSSSETPYFSGAAALSSSDQSRILVTRAPRQVVSLWTCSKLCAIFFAAGVIVGYTLKRRVRRWASRLLKRLKDE